MIRWDVRGLDDSDTWLDLTSPLRPWRMAGPEDINTSDTTKPVLVLFSGKRRDDSIAATLRRMGTRVVEYDIKIDKGHDLLKPALRNKILRDVANGIYSCVFIATPCTTFSVALNETPLRTRAQSEGKALPVVAPHVCASHLLTNRPVSRLHVH